MKSGNNNHAGYMPVLFIFSFLLVTNCSTLRTTPLPEVTPSIASIIVTATYIPTETSIPTSVIQTGTHIEIATDCIKIEEKIPGDLTISGVWIRNNEAPYLENLEENTTYGVPLKGGEFGADSRAISPDGKYLAYIDIYRNPENHRAEKRILRIIKSSGHSLNMDYWTEDWQWILGWVDTQNLALFTGRKEIIILNPFTGAWRKLDYPDWLPSGYTSSSEYSAYYYPHYDYIPALDWFLISPSHDDMEVRDAQSGEMLWKLDNGSFTWSVDGSTLLVERENIITLMTKQDKGISKFDLNELDIHFYETALSPNGKKIALLGRQQDYSSDEFLIFDRTQGRISKICLNDYGFQWDALSWSMDNRFIVQGIYDQQYNDFDLLIDTENLKAYKLVSGDYQHRLVFLALP